MNRELWVVLMGTSRTSLGLLQKGKALATEQKLDLGAILVQKEIRREEILLLSASGADRVYHVPAEQTFVWAEKTAAETLARLAGERKPRAILFEYSVFASSAAPMLAVLLEAGITADCTDLRWESCGDLLQIRPSFGGCRLAVNRSREEPYLATVRRGVFPYHEPETAGYIIPVISLPSLKNDSGVQFLETLENQMGSGLEEAEIIISGGLGMGSPEAFARLYYLSNLLGAAVGASRAAVAAGYANYSRQIGQTGTTVKPKLYLALGISGAVQHMSGIMNSGIIIAVNHDPKAPIHRYSDYSIYADCNAFVEAFISRLESKPVLSG